MPCIKEAAAAPLSLLSGRGEGPGSLDRHIGARIRLARGTRNLSMAQLAERCGVTYQQMQKYERGQNRVSASRLYVMARALNLPIGFFYEEMAGLPPLADGIAGTDQWVLETSSVASGITEVLRDPVLQLLRALANGMPARAGRRRARCANR